MANTIVTRTIIEQGAYHKEVLYELSIDSAGTLPALDHDLGFSPTKIIINDCMCTDHGSLSQARVFPQVRQAGGSGTAISFDVSTTQHFAYTNGPAAGTEMAYISVWVGLEHSISD